MVAPRHPAVGDRSRGRAQRAHTRYARNAPVRPRPRNHVRTSAARRTTVRQLAPAWRPTEQRQRKHPRRAVGANAAQAPTTRTPRPATPQAPQPPTACITRPPSRPRTLTVGEQTKAGHCCAPAPSARDRGRRMHWLPRRAARTPKRPFRPATDAQPRTAHPTMRPAPASLDATANAHTAVSQLLDTPMAGRGTATLAAHRPPRQPTTTSCTPPAHTSRDRSPTRTQRGSRPWAARASGSRPH